MFGVLLGFEGAALAVDAVLGGEGSAATALDLLADLVAGLEVALVAHYRVAVPSAKGGLPEVNIGLLPGAGGTQRLPRIVGVEKALEMVTSGQHVPAKAAHAMGLFDELVEEGKLREGAIAFAKTEIGRAHV